MHTLLCGQRAANPGTITIICQDLYFRHVKQTLHCSVRWILSLETGRDRELGSETKGHHTDFSLVNFVCRGCLAVLVQREDLELR